MLNPLDSQDPLILSEDRRFLFAVNAGSNEVVSMGINGTGACAGWMRYPAAA